VRIVTTATNSLQRRRAAADAKLDAVTAKLDAVTAKLDAVAEELDAEVDNLLKKKRRNQQRLDNDSITCNMIMKEAVALFR